MTRRLSRLQLGVLLESRHRADPGNRQEGETGHLQPKLVQHVSKGSGRRHDSLQNCRPGAASADLLGQDPDDDAHFPRDRDSAHRSILTVMRATMTPLSGTAAPNAGTDVGMPCQSQFQISRN